MWITALPNGPLLGAAGVGFALDGAAVGLAAAADPAAELAEGGRETRLEADPPVTPWPTAPAAPVTPARCPAEDCGAAGGGPLW
jgi:hypothetical protein